MEPPRRPPALLPAQGDRLPRRLLRPDPGTLRAVPWLGGEGWALGEWVLPDGRPVPLDPRAALRRVLDAAAARGLRVRAGFEFEFYLLEGTRRRARGARLRRRPADRPHPPLHVPRPARRAGSRAPGAPGGRADESGLALESANCETGQSQIEVNVRYDEALRAADDAFLFKQAVKAMAAADGRTASFMAKPREDWAGSSCHVHVSLWSPDGGQNLLATGPPGRPTRSRARPSPGMLATLPAATAILCPTVNSSKRLVPYCWAATTVSWGPTTARRRCARSRRRQGLSRIEHRMPGADVNPYLALAAIVAGALHGIEQELGAAAGDDGRRVRRPHAAPRAALARPRPRRPGGRRRARRHLGGDLVDHLCRVGRAEVGHHQAAVSDWERRRYLELA